MAGPETGLKSERVQEPTAEAFPGDETDLKSRHKAELLALEAQMQAKLETLTRANIDLTNRLEEAVALLDDRRGKEGSL